MKNMVTRVATKNRAALGARPEKTVAQTSKSAVSRISKSAAAAQSQRPADLEVGDTAGLETCATVTPPAPAKVRVATMWLSGCSGCHMSFLDLDERLVELVKLVDILHSPIVDTKDIPEVDVGIVEGCVNNNEQEHELKKLRSRCKVLIALGDCAVTGNIPALRNQFQLRDVLLRAYEQTESTKISCIPNDPVVPVLTAKARPLQEVVKVDLHIPGCPPDADVIWYALTELLAGRMPQWSEKNLRYD